MKIDIVAVALSTGLALGAPSFAHPRQHPRPQPFYGIVRGEVGWSASDACLPYQPVLTQTEAKGVLRGLGRSTVAMTHCANDTGGAFDGKITMTAANGEQVLATYTAQTVSASDGLLVMQMSGTWAGGTGCFEHATGSFTAMVYVHPGSEPPTLETRWPLEVVFAGMLVH